MPKLSVYETSWIDLVFQYRNKECGAVSVVSGRLTPNQFELPTIFPLRLK